MGYDPNKHHRQSIRLRDYDYATSGAYFVTICLQHRLPLLGNIVDGQMICNDAGNMILRWWQKLPEKFSNVVIDEFTVMPDHVHGIIIIKPKIQSETTINAPVGATPRGRPEFDENAIGVNSKPGQPHGMTPTKIQTGEPKTSGFVANEEGQPRVAAPTVGNETAIMANKTVQHNDHPILGDVVGWFKTMTTNEYIRGVKQLGWLPFYKRFWQRDYYERIMRNEKEFNAVRLYIQKNP